MFVRTLTASVLALGLLAPAAFAANEAFNSYNNGCSMDQTRDGDFLDCKAHGFDTSSKGFAVVTKTSGDAADHWLEGSTRSRAGLTAPSAN